MLRVRPFLAAAVVLTAFLPSAMGLLNPGLGLPPLADGTNDPGSCQAPATHGLYAIEGGSAGTRVEVTVGGGGCKSGICAWRTDNWESTGCQYATDGGYVGVVGSFRCIASACAGADHSLGIYADTAGRCYATWNGNAWPPGGADVYQCSLQRVEP